MSETTILALTGSNNRGGRELYDINRLMHLQKVYVEVPLHVNVRVTKTGYEKYNKNFFFKY